MQSLHYFFIPSILSLLLVACSGAPIKYKVLGTAEDSGACQINENICVATYQFRPVNYEKDEMLITYNSQKPSEIADAVLKKYKLRAKRSDNLDSINTTMITAATNGQDPYDVVKAIKHNEKEVDANTSNFFTTAAIQTGGMPIWPLGLTGVGAARQRTAGGGVIIGMIDTPIDIDHAALHSTIDRIDLVPQGDALNRLHGTEVAGILISRNSLIGIAPDALLVAISAFSTNPNNPDERRSNSGLIAKALEIAMQKNVQVLNLSFEGHSDPLVDRMVEAAVQKGIVVVASAGNGGPGAQPAYPAALPGVIAVTAVDQTENVFSRANRGDYIDLAAPGVSVLTTAPRDSFRTASGTSMAAAHVSGLIALMKSLNPAFNPEWLNFTATDLGQPGRDSDYGYGLINAERVLSAY
ncbi:S8 family serine peptidase [Candidatus Thiothrix sp. Deng01]|uniref:S8 family serine peptidase n=1 Tax=Candidatus Thiothrix phosphatis TaxID=3112415 RepID=A0ABU6D3V9_9GAMM|nr:S8 family serine peptidase [Candidatus Thiothrix sp. Deng01]MEB4593507.1 S8 family serine peptidase [Candidatus Thiothrix sp. Deng01]